MINTRIVVISVLGSVLSAAALICAQDVKPFEPVAIQELALQPRAVLVGFSLPLNSIPPSGQAPDLSRYREFQLGMTLPAVVKQTDTEPTDVTVIHERPALIQELNWRLLPAVDSSSGADPVESVIFSFYDGELFRMAVNYAEDRTEGLTDADMVKAISATYGAPSRPAGKTARGSLPLTDISSRSVTARWETAQYSISLIRSNGTGFGMVLLSKPLDALARTAAAEGTRIEEREAPQREIERQKQQADEDRAVQMKAKLANQAAFRP